MQIDIDDTNAMLRALLVDRFKIVTHVEHRPVDAYTLVVADKPKLQPADPSQSNEVVQRRRARRQGSARCKSRLNRLVTIQNMTMAQFAEDLSSMRRRIHQGASR